MASVTFESFISLAGSVGRRSDDGRVWRLVGRGLWTTRGASPAARPKVEPLPADVAPLSVSLAAAVTLGGLGWLIYRRNLLAGSEEAGTSWIEAMCDMLSTLFRSLALLPRRARSGRRELGRDGAAPKRTALGFDPFNEDSGDGFADPLGEFTISAPTSGPVSSLPVAPDVASLAAAHGVAHEWAGQR